MNDRRLVILESPYGSKDPAEVALNVAFARACVRDALNRGEAPIASHLLYTQPGILRDEVAEERAWGIDAGLAWRRVAEASVVYTDLGVSPGMQKGITAALEAGRRVERRTLASRFYAGPPDAARYPFPQAHAFVGDLVTASLDILAASGAPAATLAELGRWNGQKLAAANQVRRAAE